MLPHNSTWMCLLLTESAPPCAHPSDDVISSVRPASRSLTATLQNGMPTTTCNALTFFLLPPTGKVAAYCTVHFGRLTGLTDWLGTFIACFGCRHFFYFFFSLFFFCFLFFL